MLAAAVWSVVTWLTLLVMVSGKPPQCEFCQCTPLKGNQNSLPGMELNCTATGNDVSSGGKRVLVPSYDFVDNQVTYVWAYFRRNNISQVQILNVGLVSRLFLDENDISVIYDNAFTNFGRTLTELSLSHNKLSEVRFKVFEQLRVLEVLDLSYNLLTDLNFDDLNLKNTLKTLKLSANQISSITNRGSRSALSLESLDLSNNLLTSINKTSFLNLTRLTSLNLSNNKLTTVQWSALEPLTTLKSLDLSHNYLTTFFIVRLRSIIRLDIGYNNVTDLQKVLKYFPSIQELYVQRNGIQNLTSSNELLGLKALNLSGNALTAFLNQKFPNLVDLDLSSNNFNKVPEALNGKNMPVLKTLSFDSNPLTEVEFSTTRAPFKSLERLSLSYIEDLQALSETSFSWLTEPGEGYTGMHLTVSHNPRLAQVHKHALKYVKLVELDLSYNALTSVPLELAPWVDISVVDLQGNPWDCQCSLQWMVDEVVMHIYKNGDRRFLVELRCENPAPLRDRRLVHFYNWKTPAFCSKDNAFGRLKSGEDSVPVEVSSGSSEGMLIAVSVLGTIFLVLVIVGLVVHYRHQSQRRARNRRL